MESLRSAGALSDADKRKHGKVLRFLEEGRRALGRGGIATGQGAFALVKEMYQAEVARMREETARAQAELHALFSFVEESFGQGNEMLILVTELTRSSAGAGFIGTFGCPDYARHSGELMLTERRDSLGEEIAGLDLYEQ